MNKKIENEIKILKKEKNAIILAHSYQRGDVQDIADFVGDSLGLCIKASQTDADIIIFCGVHFMAESAKLINPQKTVLLPDSRSGCAMANMATGKAVRALKRENPEALVVCYVNSTAEVKGESDICCTSSNAVSVVNSLPENKPIIFLPDQHLGRYVENQTGRKMILWSGHCPTHQSILPEDIRMCREQNPDACVLVHPECSEEVTNMADAVGSTGFIYDYCSRSDEKIFIIGTEIGILHRLRRNNPDKVFIPASENAVCPDMKLISGENILRSLTNMETQIRINGDLAKRAYEPIRRMMEL